MYTACVGDHFLRGGAAQLSGGQLHQAGARNDEWLWRGGYLRGRDLHRWYVYVALPLYL